MIRENANAGLPWQFHQCAGRAAVRHEPAYHPHRPRSNNVNSIRLASMRLFAPQPRKIRDPRLTTNSRPELAPKPRILHAISVTTRPVHGARSRSKTLEL